MTWAVLTARYNRRGQLIQKEHRFSSEDAADAFRKGLKIYSEKYRIEKIKEKR
ncbi:TPA: hypothetical protein TY768_000902 [Streptococcus suis]|nr:hypothetical protein [Streptococcus suis]